MHVIVERDALAPALDALSKVIGRTTIIPILSNVLIQADGTSSLRLCGHALDFWMSVTIKAEVSLPGEITVPADTLRSIVKGVMAGAQISLNTKTKSGRTELRAGRSLYKLDSIPAADFPPMDADTEGRAKVAEIPLTSADAKTLLDRPRFAIGHDKSKAFFHGVFLHPRDGRLWGMGSDGYRMYGTSIPLPTGTEAMPHNAGRPGVLLPEYALDGIVRALEAGGTLAVDESKFVARGAVITFSGKYLDLAYPDMWRVITPRDGARRAVADRNDIARAVTRLLAVNTKAQPAIKVDWKEGDEDMRLTAANSERGEGEEFVPLFERAQGNHSAECRAQFVSDVMSAADGELIEYVSTGHSLNIWLADPKDLDTVSCLAEVSPKHAAADDDAEASDAA